MEFPFRIVNVFASDGQRLSGNPLCVFEDGSGLADDAMQSLARQFNLSETTFVLRPSVAAATARVRIFTPAHELPFAGHPTLGTAHVVRSLLACGDSVDLEMKAGVVRVTASGDAWTLRTAYAPRIRRPSASLDELAAMLRLPAASLSGEPLWVDTGFDQLLIPVARREDVLRACPDPDLLARHGTQVAGSESAAYVWARISANEIESRFFFMAGGLREDPATGSACANLGGWLIATGAALPLRVRVRQGECVGRPSLLSLHVDEERNVFVGGQVVEVGRGTVSP